jgi:hypothetical protein
VSVRDISGMSGVELMNQISEGGVRRASSAYVREIREKIVDGCEELLDVGARIRPLHVGEDRIGWVRGVHPSERRALNRWLHNEFDLMHQVIFLGTSLSKDEVSRLSLIEMRTISRIIARMTESDLRLYPFMDAFATTTVSEQLWFSKGTEITAYRDREIEMPDGAMVRLLTAPDHARLWAALCTYRETNKTRVDNSLNALMTIRPHVGKSAEPIANELKAAAKALIPDSLDPWTEVIRERVAKNLDDGWAHGEDNSVEGMRRELDGMISGDRHERVMAAWKEQLLAKAEERKQKLAEALVPKPPREEQSGLHTVMTDEQVRERIQYIRSTRNVVFEEKQIPEDRLAKYQ